MCKPHVRMKYCFIPGFYGKELKQLCIFEATCLLIDSVWPAVHFRWTFPTPLAAQDQYFCKLCQVWKQMKRCSICIKVSQSIITQRFSLHLEKDHSNWQNAKEEPHRLKLSQGNVNCFNILISKHSKTISKYCLCKMLNRNCSIMTTVKLAKQLSGSFITHTSTNLFLMWVLNEQSWWGTFVSEVELHWLSLCTSQEISGVV